MNEEELELKTKGEDVLKQIGALTASTNALNEITEETNEEQTEVTGWITLIGKTLLSIFK